MKNFRIVFVVILIMVSGLVSKAQTITGKTQSVDNEELAQKLVNQCANIHEGENVVITGGVRDMELLENIAVHVRKTGAFPLIAVGSDRLTRRLYTDVPVKYDSQIPDFDMKLSGFVNAQIAVDFNENPGLLADIPPERIIAMAKASDPVTEIFMGRKIRLISLGNELYPTEAKAKQFGITLNELSDFFWKGINVDYRVLEATGKAVKTILSAGKEVQITNPNGTDIKMRIESRPVIVLDGIISDEDLRGDFAGSQVYLPAGEVCLAPVQGTAEGKVVVDHAFVQGKEINGLTLIFEKGKLISMTALSGLEPLKKLYDAAESGKEELSSLDLGINPDISIKPGSKLVAWMPAGMVTVGIGNNLYAGGNNKNSFGDAFHLPGSTLTIDGKILVEKGILKK